MTFIFSSRYGDQESNNEYKCKRITGNLFKDPNRPRPPPHLKGRALGLWYYRNSRGGKMRREIKDIGDRAVVSLTQDEKYLTSVLEDVKENDDRDDIGSFSDSHIDDNANTSLFNNLVDNDDFEGFSLEQDPVLDNELYVQSQNNDCMETNGKVSRAYENILAFRRQLPSFKMQDKILEMVRNNQVSLISGETGCGKTTQVGQFILDDYITRKCGSTCHIICTQPRRISAISVAERVSAERNEPIGKSCGYQIRLENNLPRKQGSILFCTLGVLLRFMIKDPNIIKASHIIIDEIHERSTPSDFLLVIIKDILPARPTLKIILMSATLNAEIFSRYFSNCPMLEIPGSAYNVQDYYLEDIMGMISYKPTNIGKPRGNDRWGGGKVNKDNDEDYLRYLHSIEYKYPPDVICRLKEMQFDKVDTDLIMSVVIHINQTSPDGAILIFVPGWKEIRILHKSFDESHEFSNRTKFIIIPLHSRLPTVFQREVFKRPPPGCRKIIIATNIAETSITIDDVVFVIDCGKDKETNFNMDLNVSSLESGWISKASEKQRRGRAGRVQDGYCFHLFTMFHLSQFRDFQLPEMLRTPLDSLCLQIKILKLGNMWDFLCKAIEPPLLVMCELAIKELVQMRALDENESLTSLGYHLAILPVAPKIGRMILFGAIFSCLDPILTVAASLDSKDPFLAPLGKEKEADREKRILAHHSKSDHIALINAFKGWEEAKRNHSESNYCWEHFLSMNHLNFIAGIKNQFAQLLHYIGFVQSSNHKSRENNINSENINVIKAVICAGLYPNVAKLEYNSKRTRVQGIYTIAAAENPVRVELHPKSVNKEGRGFDSQWLIYHEKMKIMNNVYLFDSTLISPYPLLFFGGTIRYHEESGQETIEVDRGIKFHSSIKTAKLVMDLREELDKLLEKKIRNPTMQLIVGSMHESDDEKILKVIIDLITVEKVTAKRLYSETL